MIVKVFDADRVHSKTSISQSSGLFDTMLIIWLDCLLYMSKQPRTRLRYNQLQRSSPKNYFHSAHFYSAHSPSPLFTRYTLILVASLTLLHLYPHYIFILIASLSSLLLYPLVSLSSLHTVFLMTLYWNLTESLLTSAYTLLSSTDSLLTAAMSQAGTTTRSLIGWKNDS